LLLFDANLSPKLVSRLAERFPGSMQVFETGLVRNSPDEVMWDYAKTNGLGCPDHTQCLIASPQSPSANSPPLLLK
jgi:hypothetical protein